MKKAQMLMLMTTVIGAVGFWSFRTTGAHSAPAPGDVKIAVVSVTKVLTECQANLDRRDYEKGILDKIEADLKEMSAESDAIKEELQNALQPGTPEFMEKRKDWFMKQAELQALQEYQKEALTADKQAWTEVLYANLLVEIEAVARGQEITLVLNKDESSSKTRNLTELLNLIVSRKVLYNSPMLDITATVLERMNELHAQEKASK